jgi:hypothetical protein
MQCVLPVGTPLIQQILEFLESPPEIVLLIGVRQKLKNISERDVSRLDDSLDLTNFDESHEIQYNYALETLIHFDQILKKITTLETWSFCKEKSRQILAANLKAKMTALETLTATKATSAAINKAAENINNTSSQNLYTDLRITCLKKILNVRNKKSTKSLTHLKTEIHPKLLKKLEWKPLFGVNGLFSENDSSAHQTKTSGLNYRR